ncbi:hypothetical protein BD310DRAFT_368168 [Dichomitus squalens]|uniref:Uncharacterized protein n=1 Tax=Dichomitus squalens TaxID=114155 RepID=A0A4Q9PDY2_9APHY|nr:hypothetical protein BD310DRAFT_368168 [Dichomitus squalens]
MHATQPTPRCSRPWAFWCEPLGTRTSVSSHVRECTRHGAHRGRSSEVCRARMGERSMLCSVLTAAGRRANNEKRSWGMSPRLHLGECAILGALEGSSRPSVHISRPTMRPASRRSAFGREHDRQGCAAECKTTGTTGAFPASANASDPDIDIRAPSCAPGGCFCACLARPRESQVRETRGQVGVLVSIRADLYGPSGRVTRRGDDDEGERLLARITVQDAESDGVDPSESGKLGLADWQCRGRLRDVRHGL